MGVNKNTREYSIQRATERTRQEGIEIGVYAAEMSDGEWCWYVRATYAVAPKMLANTRRVCVVNIHNADTIRIAYDGGNDEYRKG